MVADILKSSNEHNLISIAHLVKYLVEGFEDRLGILLSKICIKVLLEIHK
jgi:hypothetical protein